MAGRRPVVFPTKQSTTNRRTLSFLRNYCDLQRTNRPIQFVDNRLLQAAQPHSTTCLSLVKRGGGEMEGALNASRILGVGGWWLFLRVSMGVASQSSTSLLLIYVWGVMNTKTVIRERRRLKSLSTSTTRSHKTTLSLMYSYKCNWIVLITWQFCVVEDKVGNTCQKDFFMMHAPKKCAKLQLRTKLQSLDFVQLRIRSWTNSKDWSKDLKFYWVMLLQNFKTSN